MKKVIALLLSCSLLLVVATACGAGDTGDTAAASGDAATGGIRESIIRMTVDATPVLDPAANAGNSSSISYVNLYDTLVFPAAEGMEPNLAETWEANETGDEYTFTLKQGVKFHDGTELTASDVVFSAERMITIGEGFAYLYSGLVEEVTAPDDYTVVFNLAQPYGPFVDTLNRLYILNEELVMANTVEGAYGDFGDYGRAWLLENDAGSGPYMATEMVQNDYFLASRFADWHGGWEERADAPEQFRLIYGTEAATVRTMMSTQALEISDMWQTAESLTALDGLDGVDLASYSTRLVQNVYFNTTIAPTDDVNVRKALSCLLDYETLIEQAFPGSTQPAGPVSSLTAGHVDCTQYPYSIEEALSYIEQSEYADTIGDYTIEFLQVSENAHIEKVTLAFQAAAAEAGLNVEISNSPWTTVQELVSTPETTPHLSCINSGPSFNEAGATLESQFHSKTAGTYENVSWISNPELDAQIEEAMSTIDRDERFEQYADLQHYITDELCPTAWLADLTERVAYQSTYVDFPAAEASANGEILAYPMGYNFFMPDISVYTDR